MNDTDSPSRISRRDVLGLSVGGAVAGILNRAEAQPAGTQGEATSPEEHPHPNILLLHCHDLGQWLGCYGVETVQTPNLDRLASEGVRFQQSYCTAPQCSPSRASIFTGRYPHNNGVLGLTHAEFAWDLNPDEKHLGQYLRDAGYETAGVGVIHETHSHPERLGLSRFTPASYAPTVVEGACKTLDELASQDLSPFYLQVGFVEPHRLPPTVDHAMGFLGPGVQPDDQLGVTVPGYLKPSDGTKVEIAELQGAIKYVDEAIGQVLNHLDQLGLRDETLVIFTVDHGVALPRAKCTLYDPGLQVPLILRYPGRTGWHGGVVREEMISNIDYLPTWLELLGLTIPDKVQGRSLCSLLDGGDYTPREEIYGEITYHDFYDPRRCIRTHTHKLIANFSAAREFMDSSQSWRPRSETTVPEHPMLAYHPPFELYDLVADPWEQVNLADEADHRSVRDELITRLHDFMVATEDPLLQGAVTCPLHHKTLRLMEEA